MPIFKFILANVNRTKNKRIEENFILLFYRLQNVFIVECPRLVYDNYMHQ